MGKSINYYLWEDTSTGIVECSINSSTGVAYKIPRTPELMKKCRSLGLECISNSGIYFLLGTADETGKNVVYVGQADVRDNGHSFLARLSEHMRNPDKYYWTEALVFTTLNDFLGATELNWVENRFCKDAEKVSRYQVKNSRKPSKGKPTKEVISNLEEYVEFVEMITGVLGHKVFERLDESNRIIFYCSRNNTNATGYLTSEGFVVARGSKIAPTIDENVSKGYKKLRDDYADMHDASWCLTEDILFSSPSAASTFVIGKSSSGLVDWKTSDGKTIKDIEAAE